MDSVRSLTGAPVNRAGNDRQGGGRRAADAFRRAMQQQQQSPEQPVANPEQESALRSKLQQHDPDGRKSSRSAHYVDVIA